MEGSLRYRVVVSWSDEDDAFLAEVPGCAADGQTYLEAVANVEAAMREWLEMARSLERDIAKAKGK